MAVHTPTRAASTTAEQVPCSPAAIKITPPKQLASADITSLSCDIKPALPAAAVVAQFAASSVDHLTDAVCAAFKGARRDVASGDVRWHVMSCVGVVVTTLGDDDEEEEEEEEDDEEDDEEEEEEPPVAVAAVGGAGVA